MFRASSLPIFRNKIWIIIASGWLFKNKSIMMHGNMNVKFTATCFGLYKRSRHQADNVAKKICDANNLILRKISMYAVEF